MKIIATSTGQTLDAALDPRLGRCAYFALIDTQSGALEAIPNPFLDAAGGAGTQAAQWVLDQNTEVLITGQCGPKATTVLRTSDIKIVEGASGSLSELIAPYAEATEAASLMTEQTAPTQNGEQNKGVGRGRGRCGRHGAGNTGCGGGGRGRGMGRGKGLGRQGSN